ncbi:MAG: hypothetical protein ABWZ76_10840 [Acidimicrobiales bacterium]
MPTPPHLPPRSRRRRAALAAVVLGLAVAGPGPALAGTTKGPTRAREAPAAPVVALAQPSPDLPGLPSVSLELAEVEVDSVPFRRARASYVSADGALASRQARRVELDRVTTATAAQRGRLEAQLAVAQARAAGLRSRLDDVSAAVADLGVRLFLAGDGAARMDAALIAENPAITDHDRRDVLGSATLDVLLAERRAYRVRLDEVTAGIQATSAELEAVSADLASLVAERPAAADAELAAAPAVADQRVGYERERVLATVEGVEFPLVALDAYHRAAASVAEQAPACGVRWWAIAGISRVEGRHGTYGGAVLDARGDQSLRIIGIQLNGTNATRVVGDTDGGALDGDPAFDRAVGPMQFIPGTWSRFAADGNADGIATPFNLYDATLAAARYLCYSRGGLDADDGLRAAYFSYNHSLEYVENVLGHARAYEQAVAVPDPVR